MDKLKACSYCGGEAKITNSRTVSAPYFLIKGCGGTTFPLDFDILTLFFKTMPCVSTRVKGSSEFTSSKSRSVLCINRA